MTDKVFDLLANQALGCECGSVSFNLIRNGNIECHQCGEPVIDCCWGERPVELIAETEL